MTDTFIRSPDEQFVRLNDDIFLTIPRGDACLERSNTDTIWSKNGDPQFIRRWDQDNFLRLRDFPLKRPSDNPTVERPASSDTFTRRG